MVIQLGKVVLGGGVVVESQLFAIIDVQLLTNLIVVVDLKGVHLVVPVEVDPELLPPQLIHPYNSSATIVDNGC